MTRTHKTTQIQTPIEQVFDYVTTPGNWPQWHPSSLSVSGATDHSLEPGEKVTEEYRVAPHRWVIDGRTKDGGGTIAYTLIPHARST